MPPLGGNPRAPGSTKKKKLSVPTVSHVGPSADAAPNQPSQQAIEKYKSSKGYKDILKETARVIEVQKAKAGKPFRPGLVNAAVQAGIPEAKGLKVTGLGTKNVSVTHKGQALDYKKGGEKRLGGYNAGDVKALHIKTTPYKGAQQRNVLTGGGKLISGLAKGGTKLANEIGKHGGIVGKAGADVVSIVTNTPANVYGLGSELAHGHVGKVAGELVKPTVETITHPKKSFTEHPVGSILSLLPVGKAVGRGAGAAARSGALGKGAKAAGSTVRAPKTLPGTDLAKERAYSKDIITKGVQKATEAAKRKVGVNPDILSARDLRSRTNQRAGTNEGIRQEERAASVHKAKQVLKGNTKAHQKQAPAVSLVAQGIIKPTRADLGKYIDEIRTEGQGLTHQHAAHNKALIKQLEEAHAHFDDAHVGPAAKAYAEHIHEINAKLVQHGVVNETTAARTALIPYAVRNMNAKVDPETGAIYVETARGKGGRNELSLDQIREDMRANGFNPNPAFVTQAPFKNRAGNYYVADKGQLVGGGHRTGKATKQGTFDASHESLVGNAAKLQGLASNVKTYGGWLKEFGARNERGKIRQFSTYKQALQEAKNMLVDEHGAPRPDAVEFVPVRTLPHGHRKEQLEGLLNEPGTAQAIHNAVTNPAEGEGPFILVPKASQKVFQKHVDTRSNDATLAVQAVTGAFRRSTLPFSPKFVAQNVTEAGVRGAIHGSTLSPRPYLVGKKVYEELQKKDPEAAQEFLNRALGGGQGALAHRVDPYRDAEKFHDTSLEKPARVLAAVRNAKGIKPVADGIRAYTDWVFHIANGKLEHHTQLAMFGKEVLKETDLVDKRVSGISQKAVEEAADGLTNTNTQARFTQSIQDAYGKYNHFSPETKYFIRTYTPFLPWTLNCLSFLFHVMPRDHPVLTAALANADQAMKDYREENGLRPEDMPPWMRQALPWRGGLSEKLSTGTPAGLFGGQGVAGNIGKLLLPQIQGSYQALNGRDWKNKELKNDDGTPYSDAQKAGLAIWLLMKSTTPGLNPVVTGGGTAKSFFGKPKIEQVKNGKSSGTSSGSVNGISQSEINAAMKAQQGSVTQGPSQSEIQAAMKAQGY